MYKQEAIKPYNEGDKQQQVEQMFDNIAPTYDQLNHRLSWNIDRLWRRKAIKKVASYKPRQVLDVATGTGDFAIMAARMLGEGTYVTATDISEGMMNIGKQKMTEEKLDRQMHFERQDSTDMTFEDNKFDAVISAFGIRNFNNLDKGLAEMCRVMRKGGLLCILELTQPVAFPMKQLFHVYAHTVLPVYGRLVSKDPAAYSYLTKTIEAFPQGEQMVGILSKAGFSNAGFQRLTLGICTMYFATKQ